MLLTYTEYQIKYQERQLGKFGLDAFKEQESKIRKDKNTIR